MNKYCRDTTFIGNLQQTIYLNADGEKLHFPGLVITNVHRSKIPFFLIKGCIQYNFTEC
jgi:hypothetical protein